MSEERATYTAREPSDPLRLALVAVLAWMYYDAKRECRAQRRRAEEAEMWLMLADEEVEAVRRRLAEVERCATWQIL